uniref:Cleavage and polyadenylation specificity factor subunit 4 n=1 Tax=Balaenoptera musculus TaxID=9771 RepID=A0A8C0D7M1_BALMU
MQEIIASVDHIKFDLEIAVEQQLGAQPLPFPGMDKSGAAVCEFFLKAACGKGGMCPFRHISGEKTVVCKHWLRGLCKKGDQCEFLHEYDMTKMPECYFYSKFALDLNCRWEPPSSPHCRSRRSLPQRYRAPGPRCCRAWPRPGRRTLSAPASVRGLPETRLEIVGGGGRGGESPWFLLKLQGAEQCAPSLGWRAVCWSQTPTGLLFPSCLASAGQRGRHTSAVLACGSDPSLYKRDSQRGGSGSVADWFSGWCPTAGGMLGTEGRGIGWLRSPKRGDPTPLQHEEREMP